MRYYERMSAQRTIAITIEQALEGLRLSLANAEALLDDAKTLLANGRPTRAVALAVLAMEELGKLPRYASVDRYEREGRMKEWWAWYRDHGEKITMHGWADLHGRSPDEVARSIVELENGSVAASLHQLKMRALYTDFDGNRFFSPMELRDSEELARSLIADVERVLPLHRDRVAAASPEAWAEAGRQMDELTERARREGRSVGDLITERMSNAPDGLLQDD